MRCYCVDIEEHTHSLYMFVWPVAARQHSTFLSLVNFLTFMRLCNSSLVMYACVRGYACQSKLYNYLESNLVSQIVSV